MSIVTVGIDLAKNVFALHGIDQSGQAAFVKPKVARSQLPETVANLPLCLPTLSSPVWVTNKIASAVGLAPCLNDAATGKRRSPLLPRICGWPGPS